MPCHTTFIFYSARRDNPFLVISAQEQEKTYSINFSGIVQYYADDRPLFLPNKPGTVNVPCITCCLAVIETKIIQRQKTVLRGVSVHYNLNESRIWAGVPIKLPAARSYPSNST